MPTEPPVDWAIASKLLKSLKRLSAANPLIRAQMILGLNRAYRFVVEAKTFHSPSGEILDENIGALEHFAEHFFALGVFEIERNAAFVRV